MFKNTDNAPISSALTYTDEQIALSAAKIASDVPEIVKELDNTVGDNMDLYIWQE